jgi:hypothetical protein
MTPTLPVFSSIFEERDARRRWAYSNRGIQTKIARELKVSSSAVNAVLLYSQPSKNCRIEKALAKAGCPGMTERLYELLVAKGIPRPQAAQMLKALGLSLGE